MKYQIRHLTRYCYQHPVANSYNLACLQPRQLPYQQVLQSSIQVTPIASSLDSHLDSFGNVRHFIHLQSPHQELSVLASSIVEVQPRYLAGQLANGVGFEQLQHCFSNPSPLDLNPASKDLLLARQCRFASRMIPLLPGAAALWALVQQPHRTVLENVSALTSLISTVMAGKIFTSAMIISAEIFYTSTIKTAHSPIETVNILNTAV